MHTAGDGVLTGVAFADDGDYMEMPMVEADNLESGYMECESHPPIMFFQSFPHLDHSRWIGWRSGSCWRGPRRRRRLSRQSVGTWQPQMNQLLLWCQECLAV